MKLVSSEGKLTHLDLLVYLLFCYPNIFLMNCVSILVFVPYVFCFTLFYVSICCPLSVIGHRTQHFIKQELNLVEFSHCLFLIQLYSTRNVGCCWILLHGKKSFLSWLESSSWPTNCQHFVKFNDEHNWTMCNFLSWLNPNNNFPIYSCEILVHELLILAA